MSRFVAVALPDYGHLLPMLAVACELRRRGHELVVVTVADRAEVVRQWGCEPRVLAESSLPAGWLRGIDAERAVRTGDELNRFNLELFTQAMTRALLADLPDILAELGPDAAIVDPYFYGAASVAQAAGVSTVGVEGALAPDLVPGLADPFAPWARQHQAPSVLRRIATAVLGSGRDRAMRPVCDELNRWRSSRQLPRLASVFDECSGLLRLRPQPRGFEPPGYRDDALVQHCGAFVPDARPSQDGFPWERLDGRPLAYASLGTIVARRPELFRTIAACCDERGLQLVIGLGGHFDVLRDAELPGDPLLTRWAPQLELLARASVCFTHAGLNTTLEALYHGVPLLAMPTAFEQPGVAKRIELAGCGVVVPPDEATPERLRQAVGQLLDDSNFGSTARRLGDEMKEAGGVHRAATVIEQACRSADRP